MEEMAERIVEYERDEAWVPQPDLAEMAFGSNEQEPVEASSPAMRRCSGGLRREVSARNLQRAAAFAHETTYGNTPSVVYRQVEDGTHGNFFPASYRRIVAHPAWAARLEKAYTASHRMAHGSTRTRRELDCANSSDALLMNIFCHPTALRSARLQTLLGTGTGCVPEFGVRARVALGNGHEDRTEFDLRLAAAETTLLVEAKFSETDFQTARPELMARYPTFEETFATEMLPQVRGHWRSYQLLRCVLAAQHLDARFAVLLDARRTDLVEDAFLVYRAVRDGALRSRLHVVTWQEIAACVPRTLQQFLVEKYGIEAAR